MNGIFLNGIKNDEAWIRKQKILNDENPKYFALKLNFYLLSGFKFSRRNVVYTLQIYKLEKLQRSEVHALVSLGIMGGLNWGLGPAEHNVTMVSRGLKGGSWIWAPIMPRADASFAVLYTNTQEKYIHLYIALLLSHF